MSEFKKNLQAGHSMSESKAKFEQELSYKYSFMAGYTDRKQFSSVCISFTNAECCIPQAYLPCLVRLRE